jgi:hypothetical protein
MYDVWKSERKSIFSHEMVKNLQESMQAGIVQTFLKMVDEKQCRIKQWKSNRLSWATYYYYSLKRETEEIGAECKGHGKWKHEGKIDYITYANRYAILLGSLRKFDDKLGPSSLLAVVERPETADDLNTILSWYFSIRRHFYNIFSNTIHSLFTTTSALFIQILIRLHTLDF